MKWSWFVLVVQPGFNPARVLKEVPFRISYVNSFQVVAFVFINALLPESFKQSVAK